MKKTYYLHLLWCVLSFCMFTGCRHDDALQQTTGQEAPAPDPFNGKTIVVNQEELQQKYAENKKLQAIFQPPENPGSSFTIETNSSQAGIELDYDNIQVVEAEKFHAITYLVYARDEKGVSDNNKVYNLMYYSHDYENYYAILYQYDFSKTTKQDYLIRQNVDEVVSVYPLNEEPDIIQNISYSIASATSIKIKEITPFSDCIKQVTVAGQPCKGSGWPKHQYGEACGMSGSDRATPGYTYNDYSDCYGNQGPGNGGPGGPGSGGPGGGGGGSTPAPNPVNPPTRFIPIKHVSDILKSGGLLFDINLGNTNYNHKTLKAVTSLWKDDIQALYTEVKNANTYIEKGFAYRFTYQNGNYSKYPNTPRLTLTNPVGIKTQIDISVVAAYYNGCIHSHPDKLGSATQKGTPLFSHTDLGAVFRFVNSSTQAPNRKPSEAFIGVVNKYGFYMVMLPNSVTQENLTTRYADFIAIGALNKIKTDMEKPKWEKIKTLLKDKYAKIENTNYSPEQKKKEHETALLKALQKYGLELEIYFLAPNDTAFDGTWQKITLVNGQTQHTPINTL